VNKNLVAVVVLSLVAFLIVLPIVRSVNAAASNHAITAPALIAEGNPMPPPIPPHPHFSLFIAEGNPMPPPIPPHPHVLELTMTLA
jgi:hypothetical protein